MSVTRRGAVCVCVFFFWVWVGRGESEFVSIVLCPQFVRCLVSVFRHRFLNSSDNRVQFSKQTLNFDRYNQFE